MAPKFRACGILGPIDFQQDDWMVANFVIYHELTKHLPGEWLGCIPLHGNRPYFHLHGSPHAERIVLGPHEEDYTWYGQFSPTELKRIAIQKIENLCRTGSRGDRLIIFLIGHGDYSVHKGAVHIGNNLLHPHDIYHSRAVLRCKADITLVVDACFSGVWLRKSAGVNFRSNFEIVCGADENDTTLSWPESGSNRRRGGIFANFVASSVYGEYDLHFPRPAVLNNDGQPENVFAGTNLDTVENGATLVRKYYTRLGDMVRNMGTSMIKLSPLYPHPQHTSSGRETAPVDGLRALGLSEGLGFKHNFNNLTDPNPPTVGGVQGIGGYIGDLISAYMSGPRYPPEFATETRVTDGIRKCTLAGANEDLLNTLEGRLRTLKKAKQFARDHGVELHDEWRPLNEEENRYLKEHHHILSNFCFNEPNTSTWILPAQMLVISLIEGGRPPLVSISYRAADRSFVRRFKEMFHRVR